MIISYQYGKFSFTEYDANFDEHSYIWKIHEFYADFPFLPQLDFKEVESISFEDDRDLYLITFHPKLKREAVGGYVAPEVHPFLEALAKNKELIKTKAYELMNAKPNNQKPGRDIIAEFDVLKTEIEKIKSEVNMLKSKG